MAHLHISDRKDVIAGSDRCCIGGRYRSFQQLDMSLLVFGDELHISYVFLAKASFLEVVETEQ